MSFSQSLRVRRSREHAEQYKKTLDRLEHPEAEQDILSLVRPDCLIENSNGLATTELGFVTMTVVPAHACFRDDLTLVPGCDDHGDRGYLVLRANCVPYHSLADNPSDAGAEALAAHRRADALVKQFGSKSALRSAVRAVPWYRMCTVDDAYRAGLCEWGVRGFLSRYKLRTIGYSVGIPRVLLRFAGSYGDRICAVTAQSQQSVSTFRANRNYP